jgi:hypothetical protein
MDAETERVAKLYLELAKSAQGRFDSRRDVEWKVTVALWTLYGAASAAAIGVERISAPAWQMAAVTLVALVIVVVYGVLWLPFLAKEFKRDQRTSYFWESGVQSLLSTKLCKTLDPGYKFTEPGTLDRKPEWIRMEECSEESIIIGKPPNGFPHRSQWSQLIITVAIAVLFVFLLWAKWSVVNK